MRYLCHHLPRVDRAIWHMEQMQTGFWLVTELKVHIVTVVTTQGIACKCMDLTVRLSVLEGH